MWCLIRIPQFLLIFPRLLSIPVGTTPVCHYVSLLTEVVLTQPDLSGEGWGRGQFCVSSSITLVKSKHPSLKQRLVTKHICYFTAILCNCLYLCSQCVWWGWKKERNNLIIVACTQLQNAVSAPRFRTVLAGQVSDVSCSFSSVCLALVVTTSKCCQDLDRWRKLAGSWENGDKWRDCID